MENKSEEFFKMKIWSITDGNGVTHIINDVKICDIFDSNSDRPDCLLTGDGAKHKPRQPTRDGVLHPFDVREFSN